MVIGRIWLDGGRLHRFLIRGVRLPRMMLYPVLEDHWADFVRSLSRKGRSGRTVEIYRKSYESFWRWAESIGLPHDPGAITYRHVNAWTDWMLDQPATRGGRVQYDIDPETGDKSPRPVAPNTVRIRWANLRPFFSWWAKE